MKKFFLFLFLFLFFLSSNAQLYPGAKPLDIIKIEKINGEVITVNLKNFLVFSDTLGVIKYQISSKWGKTNYALTFYFGVIIDASNKKLIGCEVTQTYKNFTVPPEEWDSFFIKKKR